MRINMRLATITLLAGIAMAAGSACEKADGANEAETVQATPDTEITATTMKPTTTSTSTTAAPTTTTTTAPPPPPPTTTPPTTGAPAPACDPNYSGCVPVASDVDCAGGSGNGPAYTGQVNVIGSDIYDLDRDGDGIACE